MTRGRWVFLGLAGAALALCAWRAFLLAGVVRGIGRPVAGGAALFAIPVLFLACAVVLAELSSREERGRSLLWAAAMLAAWAAPCWLVESRLRAGWDFGRPGLAEAAGVPPAASAGRAAVAILAAEDGSPGEGRVRLETIAAAGVDASPPSLRRLERYLQDHGYRTVFLAEALEALRRGWALNWEPREALEAAMLEAGPSFPPDFMGFSAAIAQAPGTMENFALLERMAVAARSARIPRVKDAQRFYERLSTAYARYGDLESSNYWLERIRGLWPLYEEDIHIEPIAERQDGRIGGRVFLHERPARSVLVGLFSAPSTSTVLDASGPPVDAAFPDARGRFEFTDLLPGRYYLALRADASVLGEPGLEFLGAPGVLRLSSARMSVELFPIQVVRKPPGLPGLPPARAPETLGKSGPFGSRVMVK